jgi:group I intron endonuclease
MVVYEIRCEADGRLYIGASINPRVRKAEHFNDLRNNRHHNRFLQRAFNKYGEETFTYKVIAKFTDEAEMWLYEENLIEELSNLYNAMPGGIRGPRMKGPDNPKYGKPISEQQRRLQSEAMSGEKHPFWGRKRPFQTDFMKRNNPMHTHKIDFSGDKNPNAKHFDKLEAIRELRTQKKTWNEIADTLGVKSAEYIRRFYNKHK